MSNSRRRYGRGRAPSRPAHTGTIVIALLIVSIAVALGLAHQFHLGVPQTLVTVLIGGGAPAGLYLAWASFLQMQSDSERSERKKLSEVADDLADLVAEQWSQEAIIRQFNDYSPLSVSWQAAANRSMTPDWAELVELAMGGRSSPPPAGTWADGPGGLAGLGHDLPKVLSKVPTGRLVVVGRPGSGKTMLMVRLILDMLERREERRSERPEISEPVPVLVPLTTWDPAEQDLRPWLEDRLTIDHPALAVPISTDEGQKSRIGALLAKRMIIPVLDGLDEMPPVLRRRAIVKINETLASPERPRQLLVTCRAKEYANAVGRHDGKGYTPLRGAAAIELCELSPEHVTAYLTDNGRDRRWTSVVEELGKPTPVGQVLRTPLTVSLAAAIYNPHLSERDAKDELEDLDWPSEPDALEDVDVLDDLDGPGGPGEQPRRSVKLVKSSPNPADLCNVERYPDGAHIENHLFDAFITAAYRSEQEGTDREAKKRLVFLAKYLEGNGTTSLQWWDPKRDLAPRWLVPTVIGTICGIATAIAASLGTHVGIGIGVGFGVGMLITLAIGAPIRYMKLPGSKFDGRPGHFRPGPGMAGALAGAVLGSAAAGFAGKIGIGHDPTLFSGLPEALGIGIGGGASTRLTGGLVGGLAGGFVGGLLEGIGLGLPAGIVNGLGVGMAAGLAIWFCGRGKPARQRPEWNSQVGISGGLVIGLVLGLIAWREEGLGPGLLAGALIGGLSSWPFGLRDTDQKLNTVPSPIEAYYRDFCTFRITALAAGIAAGCAGFFGGGLGSLFEIGKQASLSTIVSNGLGIGLSSALIIGITFGFYHAASPAFLIKSWWLALREKMPWRLMRFLDEAHRKTVLRQSGAVYQFRHDYLQKHLADPGWTYRQVGLRGQRAGSLGWPAEGVAVTPTLGGHEVPIERPPDLDHIE